MAAWRRPPQIEQRIVVCFATERALQRMPPESQKEREVLQVQQRIRQDCDSLRISAAQDRSNPAIRYFSEVNLVMVVFSSY